MGDRPRRLPGETEIGMTQAEYPHQQPRFAAPHHHRRKPGELEIGDTSVLQRHPTPHVAPPPPVPQWRLRMEKRRPIWLREMIAEATGVFCYVYCGVAATATFNLSAAADEPSFGNLLTVGLGFGFGIAFALITSASTSGGHFNPAVTICFCVYSGFPWRKAPRYIISQIFGAFLASVFVYGQFHQQISELTAGLTAAGKPVVSATGPVGIFVSVPLPGQTKAALFCNEFLADCFIGLVIVSVLDPNNGFMGPVAAPWAIGLAYTVMVWGFALGTITTNLARDVGARFAAACFFGTGVLTVDKNFAAIAALTNVPATFLSFTFYHLVMMDSNKLIDDGHATHPEVYKSITRDRELSNSGDGNVVSGGPSGNGKTGAGKDNGAEIYHSTYAGDGQV